MKPVFRSFLPVIAIVFAPFVIEGTALAAIAKCEVDIESDGGDAEVDIESDGGDADDVCVVTSASPSECTLKKVIEHAYADKWCAIDHNKKYGAFVFIQDPVDGTPSPSNKSTKPGETTLTQTIVLPGKLPSDGAGSYNQGSGDPLVIAGYLLQYTDDCLAKGCSNPSSNDWEDHLLDGTFWEPQNTNHDMFDIDKWGDKEKNGDDWDPVIELPNGGDRAVITFDQNDARKAAFQMGPLSYLQLRYVKLVVKQGAALDFGPFLPIAFAGPRLSTLHSEIEMSAGNTANALFRGVGLLFQEGAFFKLWTVDLPFSSNPQISIDSVMAGTTPLLISIKRTVSRDAPFSLVDVGDQGMAAQWVVLNLHNAVGFTSPQLPAGYSLATWDNADELSCSVVRLSSEEDGKMLCRLAVDHQIEDVVRLVEYDGDGTEQTSTVESGKPIYTVGVAEAVANGEIAVAPGEAVFAADGRRIEIEMPKCPDGSTASGTLTCAIEHGTFKGFHDGVGEFDCDAGYKEDADAGRCVLDCHDGTEPGAEGKTCVVPAGHEWNVDKTHVYEACPGDPVPNVDGSDCICKDSSKEPVELESGNKCKPICTDPLMFRNEQGNCDCPDGYKKKSNKCVVKVTTPSSKTNIPRRPAVATPAEDGSDADADDDLTSASSCIGLSCLDGDMEATSGGRISGKARVAMGGGCSLAAGPSAAGGVLAILFVAVPILALIRRR